MLALITQQLAVYRGMDKAISGKNRYQTKIYLPQEKFPGVNFKGTYIILITLYNNLNKPNFLV